MTWWWSSVFLLHCSSAVVWGGLYVCDLKMYIALRFWKFEIWWSVHCSTSNLHTSNIGSMLSPNIVLGWFLNSLISPYTPSFFTPTSFYEVTPSSSQYLRKRHITTFNLIRPGPLLLCDCTRNEIFTKFVLFVSLVKDVLRFGIIFSTEKKGGRKKIRVIQRCHMRGTGEEKQDLAGRTVEENFFFLSVENYK